MKLTSMTKLSLTAEYIFSMKLGSDILKETSLGIQTQNIRVKLRISKGAAHPTRAYYRWVQS